MKKCLFVLVLGPFVLNGTGCTSPSGNAAVPRVLTVNIKQMQFQPAVLQLHAGDTVVFNNEDMVAHDITEAAANGWSSGPLPAGSSWKHPVTASTGYYCSIHPVMKGKLEVQ